MMKIYTNEVAGIFSAFKALRLPYNKEASMFGNSQFMSAAQDGAYMQSTTVTKCREDIELAKRLIESGPSHAKPMRGIIVWADIEAPLYFWSELETYRFGHERLFSASTQNTECKQLSGKALQEAKSKITYDRSIRKIDFFSYQCLRNIVSQRYNHRMPEWHQFIEWIKTLPFAADLILTGMGEQLRIHDEMYGKFKEEGCYE